MPPAALSTLPVTTPPSQATDLVPLVGPGTRLGPWKLDSRFAVLALVADQGLATVAAPGGKTETIFRGGASIGARLLDQGWVHVGDPDGWKGYLFDAYQASPSKGQKLFEVTTPDGAVHDFIHPLEPGEAYNNSFAAISPDGQWLVSGEWEEMARLVVFPTPIVNSAAPVGQRLAIRSTISLDRTVRDVQGCVFVAPTDILCSTNDPGTDLWPTPDQLLEVTLAHPLAGTPDHGRVRSLGQLPLLFGSCAGSYEVEGLDFHDGTLRVDVRPPCSVTMTVYQYHDA